MGLPVKQVIETVDDTLTAIKVLAPLIEGVASYFGGHTPTPPPELPETLRSEVELEALKRRSARASSNPPKP